MIASPKNKNLDPNLKALSLIVSSVLPPEIKMPARKTAKIKIKRLPVFKILKGLPGFISPKQLNNEMRNIKYNNAPFLYRSLPE